MGYYTKHKLEIIEGNENKTDYISEIVEISGYSSSLFKGEEYKWYDSDIHMKYYSKKTS